jgi:3-polyprenyl-4-hydroxybenzoate decarboxylase
MPFESMDDFIKAAEQVGEVLHVDGADLELDVGGLTELTAEKNGPMVVFDKFAGYPAGFRVAANANRTLRRFALAMVATRYSSPISCAAGAIGADSKPIPARRRRPVLAMCSRRCR